MPDADSPRPVANMQNIVDRTISAVPSSAYRGSVIDDNKPIWGPILIAAAVIVVIIVIIALTRS
ncbi:MAG TPA: hypothetical protein VFD27_08500 [Chthoniobacteraceae bacterium]|nr:hypothetical protein [Chthoniobacteraceae bacterium]